MLTLYAQASYTFITLQTYRKWSSDVIPGSGARRKFPRGAKFRHNSTLREVPKARPF